MTARRRPQAEIAAHFGVDVRTVGRWLKEARHKQLGTFKRGTAEDALAETDFVHATLKAALLSQLASAAEARDHRVMIACSRELRAVERDRFTVRERMGLLVNPVFNPLPEVKSERDPILGFDEQGMAFLRQQAKALEMMEEAEMEEAEARR